MTRRYIEEFSRRGNFIWYYSFAYDEYELQHVSIGTVMTVGAEYLSDYRDGGNISIEESLWKLTSEMLLDYFCKTDGVGQRCMVRQAFTI